MVFLLISQQFFIDMIRVFYSETVEKVQIWPFYQFCMQLNQLVTNFKNTDLGFFNSLSSYMHSALYKIHLGTCILQHGTAVKIEHLITTSALLKL